MAESLKDLILEKYRSQAECARAMNKPRQYLNKIVRKEKEANVKDINLLAEVLNVSVSTIVNFLS